MEVKWGQKTLDLKTVPEICKEFPISETCLYGLIHKKKVPFWECGRKYLLNLPDIIAALHVPVETNGVDGETKGLVSETEVLQGSVNEVSAGRPQPIEEIFDDPEKETEDDEFFTDPELDDSEDPDEAIEIRDDEIDLGEDVDLDLPEDPELPSDDLNPQEVENNRRCSRYAVDNLQEAEDFLATAPEQCSWLLDADGNLT